MTSNRFCRTILTLAGLVVALSVLHAAHAQGIVGTTLDDVVAPGGNYDTAAFRLWYPNGTGPVQAVVVLVPGSNEDGRSMVEDSVWRAFAVRHRLALVGCYFTDKPHAQDFIEDYVNVSKGSGQAFLDALAAFAEQSKHPELAGAPLLLWGMSAGGEFNYEFVAWKPERVIAFVVNKGGIYYTALVPRAARDVPGLLFVGKKDMEQRINTIVGLFAINRRAGALWALTEEPNAEHVVGRSQDLATIFFEDVLALRTEHPGILNAVTEKSGFLGDIKSRTFQVVGDAKVPDYPDGGIDVNTVWLPTEHIARAWRAVVTETPFDPAP